jgi:hypothetical protein
MKWSSLCKNLTTLTVKKFIELTLLKFEWTQFDNNDKMLIKIDHQVFLPKNFLQL